MKGELCSRSKFHAQHRTDIIRWIWIPSIGTGKLGLDMTIEERVSHTPGCVQRRVPAMHRSIIIHPASIDIENCVILTEQVREDHIGIDPRRHPDFVARRGMGIDSIPISIDPMQLRRFASRAADMSVSKCLPSASESVILVATPMVYLADKKTLQFRCRQ
jgi:hypothetical protein